MHRSRAGTRRIALDKLAALSAQTTTAGQDEGDDIARLCSLSRVDQKARGGAPNGTVNGEDAGYETSSIPMGARELEVLTSLCKAAPCLHTTKEAAALLRQLAPYTSEVHRQSLTHPSVHQLLPPWESLAYDLTSAVLAIGANHPSLRQEAQQIYDGTLETLRVSSEGTSRTKSDLDDHHQLTEQALPTVRLVVSILGVLNATAKYVRAWDANERIGVIQKIRQVLSEKFMVSLEGALSAVRNAHVPTRSIRDWKRWLKHYASQSKPLGAMLLQQALMAVVEESVLILLTEDGSSLTERPLHALMHRTPLLGKATSEIDESVVESITNVIVDQISFLEADSDYLQVSSAWQQRLALDVKARCLRSYLYCSLINEAIADDEPLLAWYDAITSDSIQMADETLAETVFRSMAILSRTSSATASVLNRSMPKLLVQGKLPSKSARIAGECLACVLLQLPQDLVISTLYSLGNVLSSRGGTDGPAGTSPFVDGNGSINGSAAPYSASQALGSQLSLVASDEEETAVVYGAIVQAIVAIATASKDEKLAALVLSMLVQKIGRISQPVDARIIVELASLGLCGGPDQLKGLLKLYARIAIEAATKNDATLLKAVTDARIRLATRIGKDSPLYETYLRHFLEICVSSGDSAGVRTTDLALTAEIIAQLFGPMAVLSSQDEQHVPQFENPDELSQLSRDGWFNIVVHGFTLDSHASRPYMRELQVLAKHTLPLVDENRVDIPESGIDLDTVLRRGSGQKAVEMKQSLISALPQSESDIKGLNYQDTVFLHAALLVSVLRSRSGDCTAILPYFTENKVKKTAMGNVMMAIAAKSVETYLHKALVGQRQHFAAPQAAQQLAVFFEGACHRIGKVQQAATISADRIITMIPSALCQRTSLFALLELLSLMWKSCLDAETDEYEWRPIYKSELGNVSVQISDDVHFRQATLSNFHTRARQWVFKAIDVAPMDVKGLLQAYLENYEDDGAYGHVALGRSFAVEMGSMVPSTSQRLTSIDRQSGVPVNTASDFMAQYTTRQEYRHVAKNTPGDDSWTLVGHEGSHQLSVTEPMFNDLEDAVRLRELARRLRGGEQVHFGEIRTTLRQGAGVLSQCASDRTPLIADLVGIPFTIFTKQSINLGISLWLGVVKENPSLESRILVEIAAGWEASVRLGKGFFNASLHSPDPFYVKEEFAPSKWEAISRRQQLTHDLLAPHLRLTHILGSHFNASRLVAPSVERVYGRLMRITMLAMKHTVVQPLAREAHFQIVLLALRVLRYSVHLTPASQWRLKDSILSAGLTWFARPPQWSFGSNRLQLKAELKIMYDVIGLLREVSAVGAKPSRALASLQQKQELLQLFLSQETGRLGVWTSPLGQLTHDSTSVVPNTSPVKDAAFSPLLKTAWEEDPRIAVQLATRFPTSARLMSEVRALILREPEKVIHEPDALYVLFGSSLPSDVKTQLKYLLYWAPINPMAAVTYFLPAYGNHPHIIQYAVRALESHSVDVTFFYVPQIVQTLRYDALGYVERYIVEAGRLSQLFAHQIIWNMKANAYKDEDSQQPDPVKPVLDQVMGALISSFSQDDKNFYEREFDFFGRVTGISGTLKPFIKSPKPEKKAKIEEELRKIQVEVGVYLPSNPDGVVIGIDRKSGKPLQSHAKAPYMATFRIRKEEGEDSVEAQVDAQEKGELERRRTYEVWQSAIFKVGDDCRQDVLALQMIAAFRGIFNTVGLDVYVFPYRVTATAPGCGVIDVLPNSISRDMLGREAVNGLYEYFISKYGAEDSIRFQEARSNFIKSMAAYSIISFLLQFKDRHNGNIMLDDAGHLLHIDFGFCFDVAPGGIKFERAPFKLTPEMVAVMGGSTASQPFRQFEELCVKAFLASRPYVAQLEHIVLTMLDSGLPCFKPETLKHFRERFVLEKSEREAAEFARKLVHVSERSYSTGVYDYFQLLTNGIPY